ncbi:MAG: dihydrolipoyl dehydrogenase [Firmicutes bacterium]|nr:dihydrolipoyl dehydrogenase [Bacillota bacterium]
MSTRIIVIGGGPGGYVAALRAAQLGAEVTLVEKKALGGTCLNVGCIPTKALLHTADLFRTAQRAATIGLKVEGLRVDWPTLQQRRANVVRRLVSGVDLLLKQAGCQVINGTARLQDKRSVTVTLADGSEQVLAADKIILATGSEPVRLPLPGFDLPEVILSDAALSLDKVPESMLIMGGGVIGVELASLYQNLGTRCIIVEVLPQILPNLDKELAQAVHTHLARLGIKIHTGAKVKSCVPADQGVTVAVTAQEGELSFNVSCVLAAVGRRPATAGLNLEAAGVATEQGRITVNDQLETSVPGIYAVGDAIGGIMLAHVASAEGTVAAENAMGQGKKIDYKTVPSCIYTQPEAASVGLSEEEALKAGYKVKIGRFPLAANGKALIEGDRGGFVKIVANERYSEVLGVQIFGPRATDLISEAALALRLEATLDELATTIHPHPSISEAIAEAALAANNMALHIPQRR